MDNNDQQIKQIKQINYKQLYQQQKKKNALLQHHIQLQKIKTRKLLSNKIKGKVCSKCLKQYKQTYDQKKTQNPNIKQDMKEFSQKIGLRLKKSIHKPTQPLHQKLNSLDLHGYQNKSTKIPTTTINYFPMIQNFTIFGVSQTNIYNSNKQINQTLQGQLLYSFKQPSDVDRHAGQLVFPLGVVLKKLTGQRAKDKAIQMMSFSYSNLKSFILRFKYQDTIDQQQYQKNQFLSHINPSKSLFCLCIGIHDYTSIQDQTNPIVHKYQDPASLKQIQQDQNSIPITHQQKITHISMNDTNNNNNLSNDSVPSGQLDNTQIFISQRVFCISSYYPFFTFYEEILKNIMNIVKMQRLTIYKNQNQNILQTDSKFQLFRMQDQFITYMKNLNSKVVQFNRTYQLKLANQQQITLITDWNLAKTYFIQQWITGILSMFNVQVFIDVFTLMMLQDKLIFICNNSHILTYTIYLFTNILTKPFIYAFQVVSILPSVQFLGAPFTVIYGMLKKRKSVQQSNIFEDYKNTYVFLSPDKVDIVYTQNRKNLLRCRPQKLKNDLTLLFKDLKKLRTQNQKTAKYQVQALDYALTFSIQQKKLSVQIIQKVNEFILKQIINKIPSHFQIKNLKNSIDLSNLPQQRDQHSILMDKIKNIVKKNIKDPFIEKFLDSQMFSNMICK